MPRAPNLLAIIVFCLRAMARRSPLSAYRTSKVTPIQAGREPEAETREYVDIGTEGSIGTARTDGNNRVHLPLPLSAIVRDVASAFFLPSRALQQSCGRSDEIPEGHGLLHHQQPNGPIAKQTGQHPAVAWNLIALPWWLCLVGHYHKYIVE